MQILLVHGGGRKNRQIKQWIESCYPGSHITICHNITQAMEYISVVGVHINLCFTDIQMRDGTGIQVVRALREANWRAKIVFISDTDAYAMDAWRLGVNDYLLEPLTLDSIRHTWESCS